MPNSTPAVEPDESTSLETSAELVQVVPGPSAALVAAVRRAEEYGRQTRAERTEKAYASDWRRFEAWATDTDAPTLPAHPAVVAAHLSWLADEGYSASSIERALAGVAHYHKVAGYDFERGAPVIARALDGIRRRIGTRRVKKAPLGLRALADICARDIGSRSRALLTVGWFCMLRSDNLVAIRREHVRFVRFEGEELVDDEGRPEGLIVHLPGSKTDQRKEGRDIAVHAQTDRSVCPVAALSAYLREHAFKPEELIFPLSRSTVSRLVKRLVADPSHGHKTLREIAQCTSCSNVAHRFASHSLRRGSATKYAQDGVAERDIMRHGGWKTERVLRGYIEHATLFQNNPTKVEAAPVAAPRAAPPPTAVAVASKPRVRPRRRRRARRSRARSRR